MTLLLSLTAALLVIYRISQYLKSKKKKAPVQFISAFGVSHAALITPQKLNHVDEDRGQLELPLEGSTIDEIIFKESGRRLHCFSKAPTRKRKGLGATLCRKKGKLSSNKTIQLYA